ncbi:MAG: GntR family transcriptional regulator [Streptomyces sp.]|nr:GntR family transcriptional regulator [Streptomyces sp.]
MSPVESTDPTARRKVAHAYNHLFSQLSDGTYPVGSMLPAERVLADDLNVARDTVRAALKQLKDEGYVTSQQGRGSKVVKVPTEDTPPGRPQLYHFMHRAFKAAEVTLDVYALTAESFVGHFELQVGRVEAGELAQLRRVSVRVLMPSEHKELDYPRALDPEDNRPWERWRLMARGNARKLEHCRDRLADCGVEFDLQIRRVGHTPTFKLYFVNGMDTLYGLYTPVTGRMELLDGTVVEEAVDVKGRGASLEHYRPWDELSAEYREFFDGHWALAEGDSAKS